jgi:hypothetical protein
MLMSHLKTEDARSYIQVKNSTPEQLKENLATACISQSNEP